jgi:hypothetical protein
MKKLILLLSVILLYATLYGQSKHKISMEMGLKYDYTVYDRVVAHNGEGIGIGLTLLMATKSNFKPMLEFTADIFVRNDVGYSTADSIAYEDKSRIPAIGIGGIYQPFKRIYFIFTLGPAFMSSSSIYLGIKPGVGCYIGKKNRFNAKFCLMNIFQREEASNEPFGYLTMGLGVRLF